MQINPREFPTQQTLPTVQLRHELPDGSAHIDWMIDALAPRERSLITFRLPDELDRLPEGQTIHVERLSDHRRHYLEYEGEVEGERGRVQRIANGAAVVRHSTPEEVLIEASWGDARPVMMISLKRSPSASDWQLLTGIVDENPAQ